MSPTRYLSRSFIRGLGFFWSQEWNFHKGSVKVSGAPENELHYDTVLQQRESTKRCEKQATVNGREIKRYLRVKTERNIKVK